MRGLSRNEGLDRFGNVRLRMRLLARAVARTAWVECRGCSEDAIIGFNADRRLHGIDPALIALLLQIALMLWKYWQENKIDTPSIVASGMEPVDFETPDVDDNGEVNDAD